MTVAITDLDPGTETQVNTYVDSDQDYSEVVGLADGRYVIVWQSYGEDGSGAGIYGQIFNADGTKNGNEFQVNSDSLGDQAKPDVTALADGGFVVVWSDLDPSLEGDILYQRYDSSGAPVSGNALVTSTTAGDQTDAHTAGLADGGYVIIWSTADNTTLYQQLFAADGTAIGTETAVSTSVNAFDGASAIAGLADGGYVITWTMLGDVYLQRYDAAGDEVDSTALVNTSTTASQFTPVIAALNGGGYVVAWVSSAGPNTVFAQQYDSYGDPVGGEFQVSDGVWGTESPAITGLSDGGFVITWDTPAGKDGSARGAYALRFDSGGTAVGSEILVNSTTSNDQQSVSASTLADGSLVFTWSSQGQDGSGDGVYMNHWTVADTVGTTAGEIMDGTGAAVHMLGGDGDDTYIVDSLDDTVTELPGEGNDLVDSFVSFTLGANIESLVLDGHDDIDGTGNSDINAIIGNDGDNRLDGGGGADIMMGGAGDDTYVIDAGDVYIEVDGAGYDEIDIGQTFALTEGGPFEALKLTGTGNFDGTGTSDDNSIFGNSGDNVLTGGDGNDYLDSGGGNDTLIGGDGDDYYFIYNTGTVIVETDDEGLDIVYSTISYTLGAHLDGLVLDPTGTDNLDLKGNGLDNILSGNDGNNSLNGMGGEDVMYGYGGNDVYYVNSSYDEVSEELICGCDAGGIDKVYSSTDFYLPDYVENLTLTGIGDSYGIGNDEDNVILGNSGANTIDGDQGDDVVAGGAGADTMYGGADNDTYYVDDVHDQTIEDYSPGSDDGGHDKVYASVSWTLNIYTEDLTLTGIDDIDGTGNDDDNAIRGNGGANVLDGGIGADNLAGGGGDDTYNIDNIGDRVREDSSAGTDTVVSSISARLGSNLENLTLTGSGDLKATGNDLANVLTGNDGANTLVGGGEADTLYGGAGNDVYYVDNVNDVVSEDEHSDGDDGGTDGVISSVDWTLSDYVETLKLTGTDAVYGTGNSGDNAITGNAIGNELDGGEGADSLSGGLGDDTYYVDNAGDRVSEQAGGGTADTVFASVSHTLRSNVENLTLSGTDNLNGNGNDLANTILGNGGNNSLNGRGGDDVIFGGAGDDSYYVDSLNDFISESSQDIYTDDGGTDRVTTTVDWTLGDYFENLYLGGSGAINATGNELDNVLRGNDGANNLRGMAGNDRLTGGGGADNFVFEAAGIVNGADRVYDFTAGTDHLAFDAADYGFTSGHVLAATELTLGTHAVGSDAQFIFNAARATLYWDADGAGSGAAVAIAVLYGVTSVQASDFVFN